MFRSPSFVGSGGLPPEFYIFYKYNAIDKACILKNGDFKLQALGPDQSNYPMIDVDIMELNRNPDSYYAEVVRAALVELVKAT
jgi:catalase